MNLYAYVGNDPVNFTDPLGLVTEEAWDDYLGYYSVDGTIEVRES